MRRLSSLLLLLALGAAACGSGVEDAADGIGTGAEPVAPSQESAAPPPTATPAPATAAESAFPDVIAATASRESGGGLRFDVTVSSPYDSPERYADAWRIKGPDGIVYGIRELLHDHASEQPFTRSLDDVEIPESIEIVTIEARDLVNGWGGATVDVQVPAGVGGGPDGAGDTASGAFAIAPRGIVNDAAIPVEFTCDGANLVPVVDIAAAPAGATELALVVDDPDAPTAEPFVHWVVYGIEVTAEEIDDDTASFSYGVTDAGTTTWFGPCPPRGDSPHTYRWRLFALSEGLALEGGLSGRELEAATGDAVIETAEFSATYERAR